MAATQQTDLRPLRQQIIRVATNAGEGHIPSALSILDLTYVLHNDVMQTGDRFVLSKGHGCLALYVVLAQRGLMSADALDYFCDENATYLQGHPERNVDFGIEATTGSLGHGIGMAVGMALAERISGRNGRIFCIVGDGECEEGSVWEAAHLAAKLKVSNLTVMVDANKSSPNRIDGERHRCSLADKFAAFDWYVSRINGHDHASIRRSCQPTGGERPYVVIADTVKGKGVPIMEESPQLWHHMVPAQSKMHEILESVR